MERTAPLPFSLSDASTVQSGLITRIRWSPDGRYLSYCSLAKTVSIWDLKGRSFWKIPLRAEVWVSEWMENPVKNRPGYILIIGSESNQILIWDITNRQQQALLDVAGPIYAIASTHDRKRYFASGGWDRSILLWGYGDTGWRPHKILDGHHAGVNSIAWRPFSNQYLASSSSDGTVIIWDADAADANRKETVLIPNRGKSINSICWSPSGRFLACASDDPAIAVYDCSQQVKTPSFFLTGHTRAVQALAISTDGLYLASKSRDGTVRIWSLQTIEEVARIPEPSIAEGNPEISMDWHGGLAFHPKEFTLASLGNHNHSVRIWQLSRRRLRKTSLSGKRVTTAKVLLVGESNVGKSCLAQSLAGDSYKELRTTHGTQFWQMEVPSTGERNSEGAAIAREVVLWDMGGQEEYKLLNQLFLQDSTLVLFVFDASRGIGALDQVEAWNTTVEEQAEPDRGVPIKKILIAAKSDMYLLPDKKIISKLQTRIGACQVLFTSAKRGTGITELKDAIVQAICWEKLLCCTDPAVLECMRDQVDAYREAEQTFILVDQLIEDLRGARCIDADNQQDLESGLHQLAAQGYFINTKLRGGNRALILRVWDIERYGASLLLGARDHPTGVPVIEKRIQVSPLAAFPGIDQADRLKTRDEERGVVEGVLHLFLEHGICFEHAGGWVFPALFTSARTNAEDDVAAVESSLYYEYSGATENSFSSLVVSCALSAQFGRVRLWANLAAFTSPIAGECRIKKWEEPEGYVHLAISFTHDVKPERRKLFLEFIERELQQCGIQFFRRPAIICACGFVIDEEVVVARKAKGYGDVGCPRCDSRIDIESSLLRRDVSETQGGDRELELSSMGEFVRQRKSEMCNGVVTAYSSWTDSRLQDPYKILVLSDLHFREDTNIDVFLEPLTNDLNAKPFSLNSLNYLVIAGDLTSSAKPNEYERALEFVTKLIDRFDLAAERCVIVPGNHDVDWETEAYEWRPQKPGEAQSSGDGTTLCEGRLIGRRSGLYWDRFKNFSTYFFHPLMQREYPIDPYTQCVPQTFHTGLQFLPLNSAWEIDQFFPHRSGLSIQSLFYGIRIGNSEEKEFIDKGILRPLKLGVRGKPMLRVAVWHHSVLCGDDSAIRNLEFLEHLKAANTRLAVFGHLHTNAMLRVIEAGEAQAMNYVGVGTFGAPQMERPESTPQMYTLIEIDQRLTRARVHVRSKAQNEGIYRAHAVFPDTSLASARQYYDIDLANT